MGNIMRNFIFFVFLFMQTNVYGTFLHVGDLQFELSENKYTEPSLHILKDNSNILYAPLRHGKISNTLHIQYNNEIFHACPGNLSISDDYVFDGCGNLIWANENLYLASTGTQYINTEYIPTKYTDVVIVLKFSDDKYKPNSTNTYIFGVVDILNKSTFSVNFGNLSNQGYAVFPWLCLYSESGGIASCWPSEFRITKEIKVTKNTWVLSRPRRLCGFRENHYGMQDLPTIDADVTGPIYLFGGNRILEDGTSVARIYGANEYLYKYSASFYENGKLTRYMVPVPQGLKIKDFIVPENGMFDIIEQKFYGNSGTGEFIFGKDG